MIATNEQTQQQEESQQRNVLGAPLIACSTDPLTGFFRDGCCNTGPEDAGSHTVCCVVTASFLAFSKSRGNDLSTPRPEWGFPGLKPGDRWCLCAVRWQEAFEADCAPGVILEATNEMALRFVDAEALLDHAVDAD
ncbi:MAG: DUF2237 domain-containing protein [Phycisphaerales bacterium]|nr:DUF2237 domain-containing protein [Phycisphaerales bacterium]